MFNQIQEENLIPDVNNPGSTVQLTDMQFLKKQPSLRGSATKKRKENKEDKVFHCWSTAIQAWVHTRAGKEASVSASQKSVVLMPKAIACH